MLRKGLLVLVFILMTTALTACQDPTPPDSSEGVQDETVDVYSTMASYADNFFKESPVDVVTASEVFEKVVMNPDPNYYVVDLREQDDFLDSSIKGAINIPYNSTGQEEQLAKIPLDKTIVLVCYDGSLSSKLSPILSMLDYETVIMNNGMLGWFNNPPEVCELGDNPVVTEPTVPETTYTVPELKANVSQDIESVLLHLNEQFRSDLKAIDTIDADTLHKTKDDKFLVDIRDEEHYASGHIEGAINIPFAQLAERASLELLPPDEDIVLICYTGNRAAQASTILNLLGYNTVPLAFGMSDWTTQVEVIGVQPTMCAWVSCYADENLAAGFPVARVECDWGDLPTIETFIQEEVGGPG